MNLEQIDFRQLPQQNQLFLDFLDGSEKASRFYAESPRDAEGLKKRAEALLAGKRAYPRDELIPILQRFNEETGCGERTRSNIEKLRSPRTVAILTGQQLGLFGGPAYSFYKAATAVRLAQTLDRQGVPAVPIFWMPSDDSDYQEVRSTTWIDQQGGLLEVSLNGLQPVEGRMVGPTPLTEVESCLAKLQSVSGQFASDILEDLSRSYRSDADFRSAFGTWLAGLFRDHGLILFDSLSSGYKNLVRPVFETAIRKRGEVVAALDRRRAELESAGYAAQVHTEASETLLFWLEGAHRQKLQFRDGRYVTKGDDPGRLSSKEAGCPADCPDSLGPNVLLRPILQDHLFPTVAYVGGPAEIAYFSQISAIAGFWGIQPAVFPRSALTIVGRKTQRLLTQYGLTAADVLRRSRLEITRRIVESGESSRILEEFGDLTQEVESRMGLLRDRIQKEDPPVGDMIEGAKQKVLFQLGRVQDRYVKNHEGRKANLGRHLDHLYNQLLPNSKPQERVFNFNQLLALEGKGLADAVVERLDPFATAHQILHV